MKIKQGDLLSLGVLVGSVFCVKILADKFQIPRCPTQVSRSSQRIASQRIPVIKNNEDNWENQVDQKEESSMFPNIEDESQECIFEDC